MKKLTQKPLTVFIVMIVLVLGLWWLSLYLLKGETNRGTFGDMFGAVNALFSGLAFAGLIYTILLQKEELELQRNELSETRNEFITQNETLKSQRFENTFFNLLELHHKIVDGIDKNDKKRISGSFKDTQYQFITIKGRDVFKVEYYDLMNSFEANTRMSPPLSQNEVYLTKYDEVQTDFGHYFRNVYRIIKLIDSTDFFPHEQDSETKRNKNYDMRYSYTSILRAQLSDYEILWLFYNCISDNGIEKFKPLIEKYSIFKNIPFDKLCDENDKLKFDNRAYNKTNTYA